MHLLSISDSSRYPCFLLQFDDFNILLDCSLDSSTILEYKNDFYLKCPDFDAIDHSSIDAVIISNFDNILALPFLTRLSGFRGKIYLTEPTFLFGKLLLEDIVKTLDFERRNIQQRSYGNSSNKCIKYPFKKSYTLYDVENCFKDPKIVSYHDKTTFDSISFWPVQSGYSIGSCSWVIETPTKTYFYMSATASECFNLPPYDKLSLRNIDCLIMGFQLNPITNICDNLNLFEKKYMESLNLNNVIFLPNIPQSLFYHILNQIFLSYNSNLAMKPSLSIVSPISKLLLKYSTFFIDYFDKMTKISACEIIPPFSFHNQINYKRMRLACDSSEAPLKENSFHIFNHKNFYQGNFMHYIKVLKENPNYTMILTDYGSKITVPLKIVEEMFLQNQCVHIPLNHCLSEHDFKNFVLDKKISLIIGSDKLPEINGSKICLIEHLESFQDEKYIGYRSLVIDRNFANQISPLFDAKSLSIFTAELLSDYEKLSFTYPTSFIENFANLKSFHFDFEKFKSESAQLFPDYTSSQIDSSFQFKLKGELFLSIDFQKDKIKFNLSQNMEDSMRQNLLIIIQSSFI